MKLLFCCMLKWAPSYTTLNFLNILTSYAVLMLLPVLSELIMQQTSSIPFSFIPFTCQLLSVFFFSFLRFAALQNGSKKILLQPSVVNSSSFYIDIFEHYSAGLFSSYFPFALELLPSLLQKRLMLSFKPPRIKFFLRIDIVCNLKMKVSCLTISCSFLIMVSIRCES